jgi:tetratricopeptide (TPR) repeat protein
MFKREAGELAEADEVITGCLDRFPSDIGVVNEALKLFGAANDFSRIDETLKTAHEANPENKELRIAWVKHLDDTGRQDEAEKILRESVDRALELPAPPRGPNVKVAGKWVELGSFLIDHGETIDGLDAYDSALKILGDLAAPELLFRHAEGLILAERFDEALEIADRTPIEVHPPMIRGRVAFERGEYQTSVDELQSAALQWPDNAPIRYYLARAYEGMGDFNSAIEEYRQAIRSDPTLSAARERLGKLHIAEGRIRQAQTIIGFLSPIKESKPSVEMRLLSIEIQARLGLKPSLTMPKTRDLPLDEMQRRAVSALVRGLRQGRDTESTEAILAKFQEQLADALSQGHFVRARVGLLIDAGQIERAIEIARDASKAPYTISDVDIALGHALVAANQSIDEAKDLLTHALVLHPLDLEILTTLGDIAEVAGDAATATHYYEQALASDPAYRPAFDARLRQIKNAGHGSDAADFLSEYVHRHNPYDGTAALELAQVLDAAEKESRINLAKRAIRFGAGPTALDWLSTIDPEEAAKYVPVERRPAG